MSTPSTRIHAATLIDRLMAAHQDSQQRVLGSNIFEEAADTIRVLLADEATRYDRNVALREKNDELRKELFTASSKLDETRGLYDACDLERRAFEKAIAELQSRLDAAERKATHHAAMEQAEYMRAQAAESRLDDALMRLREAVAWFDVVKSKHDTVALIHLADDWPNYWLKITRDLLNGVVERRGTFEEVVGDPAKKTGLFKPIASDEPEKCPNALLPDGPVCPRCGGRRGPSGVDGGSWVHY